MLKSSDSAARKPGTVGGGTVGGDYGNQGAPDTGASVRLEASLRHIARIGRGLVLYLQQEGVGIGLTNNPDKMRSMRALGVEVTKKIPVVIQSNDHNRHYLVAKRTRMGHLL